MSGAPWTGHKLNLHLVPPSQIPKWSELGNTGGFISPVMCFCPPTGGGRPGPCVVMPRRARDWGKHPGSGGCRGLEPTWPHLLWDSESCTLSLCSYSCYLWVQNGKLLHPLVTQGHRNSRRPASRWVRSSPSSEG